MAVTPVCIRQEMLQIEAFFASFYQFVWIVQVNFASMFELCT